MIEPLTVEQGRQAAMDRICDCEATARFDHSTETCRDFGCFQIDALIAAVRAEEQTITAIWRQTVDELQRQLAEARETHAALVAALKEIAEHPHNSYDHPSNTGHARDYGIGCADGHRCAAQVARTVLARAEPGETP